jgi:hypothetical protein
LFIEFDRLETHPECEVVLNVMMENKNRCGVCGRKGQRLCPVLTGMICTSCCGAKRGSALVCPPNCIYFPFGIEAYDLWLKVDGSWMPKVVQYLIETVGKLHFDTALSRMESSKGRSKDQLDAEGRPIPY